MKKAVFISLFIFWAAVTALLTAGLVFYQKGQTPGMPLLNVSSTPGARMVLDKQEVARHNSAGDCWMILFGKVYNFTSFINGHPGGADAIARYCGQDGTVAFQTKDQPQARDHSQRAYNMLADYYLGDLNQTVSPQQVQAKMQATSNAVPAYGGDD